MKSLERSNGPLELEALPFPFSVSWEAIEILSEHKEAMEEGKKLERIDYHNVEFFFEVKNGFITKV